MNEGSGGVCGGKVKGQRSGGCLVRYFGQCRVEMMSGLAWIGDHWEGPQ